MGNNHLKKILITQLTPYNLSLLLSCLGLLACLATIFILNNPIPEALDAQRSVPPDVRIPQLFIYARKTFFVGASFIAICLFSLLCFTLYAYFNDKRIITRFNSTIYNAYISNDRLTKLIFTISIIGITSLTILPYISHLLISPWPLASKGPLMSSADKRWLIILYNYTWLIILLVTPLLYSLLEDVFNGKTRYTENKSECIFFQEKLSFALIATSILLGTGLAFFAYGPPWNLHFLIRPINTHLMESMSSYQAIESGAIPYIGSASYGYGPGTQLITYYYQQLTGGLSVNSLRESYVFLNFLTATILFTFVFLMFKKIFSIPIVVMLISLSPLSFYEFNNSGVINGLFGWSNSARYVALPIITLSTVRALSFNKLLFTIDTKGVLIGLAWGFFAYLSQENGVLTFFSVVTVLSAAYSGKMIPFKRALWLLLSILLGAFLFFTPILAYYFYNGAGLEFITNYRLMPGYAYNGVTGLYWQLNTYRNYFILMPIIALLTGASSFLRVRPFGIVSEMTTNRLVILSIALIVLLAHMSPIIRTADSQSMNAMIGAPFMYTLLLIAPITQTKISGLNRTILFIFSLLLYFSTIPASRYPNNVFDKLITARNNSFKKQELLPKQDKANNNISSRLPSTIRNLKECCQSPIGVSGNDLQNLINQLKNNIGNKRVYIDRLPGIRQIGAAIFLAGIKPSYIYREMNSRYPTYNSRSEYTDNIKNEISKVDVVITTDINRILPKKYIEMNSGADIKKYASNGENYFVISR